MAKFVISGGNHISGQVTVSGSKNAALPILAATLLSSETSTISNVPDIADVNLLLRILEEFGATVERSGSTVKVTPKTLKIGALSSEAFKKMRASVVLVGPMLARFQKATIPQPGGCIIGVRPIDTHIHAFEELGVKVIYRDEAYHFDGKRQKSGRVILDEMSVTGTENVLMLAAGLPGKTEIHLAAAEPEIGNLIELLRSMGAKITLKDSHTIVVDGRAKLKGGKVKVIPDRIEAGTWAVAAVITKSNLLVKSFPVQDLLFFLKKMQAMGVVMEIGKDEVRFKPSRNLRAVSIKTAIHPGFATDLQAPFSVLLTQASGSSIIHETMFDGRLNYASELAKMGADVQQLDPHRLQISGPTALVGKTIESFDLRAGATLILAALVANGKSTIEKIELVDRGYEHFDKKLKSLGADIVRIEE